MRHTLLTPAQVRAIVDSHADGQPYLVERTAERLHMSRAQLWMHLKEGVQVDIPQTAQTLLDAAGVEVTTKRSKK